VYSTVLYSTVRQKTFAWLAWLVLYRGLCVPGIKEIMRATAPSFSITKMSARSSSSLYFSVVRNWRVCLWLLWGSWPACNPWAGGNAGTGGKSSSFVPGRHLLLDPRPRPPPPPQRQLEGFLTTMKKRLSIHTAEDQHLCVVVHKYIYRNVQITTVLWR
jgi:hypothetical protein